MDGIIHTTFALWMFHDYFLAMLKKGLVNTGEECPGFWFMFLEPLLLMFGSLLQHYIRITERPAGDHYDCC